ncbi:uncharacterized protein [Clytia hemisphaerica]|uniref:uncharacterized protein n=1 Tax=Clytia hemisphaerica TaxID=252671 RepID=UPI0034D4AC2C
MMLAGLDVSSCKPITVRGRGKIDTAEVYSRLLCQVLKDHASTTIINKAMKFFFEAVRRKLRKRDGLTLTENPIFEDFEEGEPFAKLTIRPSMPQNSRQDLHKAMKNIQFLTIAFTIDDAESSNASNLTPSFIPTDPICIAVAELSRFMKEKSYAICNGKIYKKAPDSAFSYVYCLTVKRFLMRSLRVGSVANVLASHINSVSNLLSDPDCGLIKPLKILYNIIEVLPARTIFVISEKRFYKIRNFPEGCTPRAFIRYTYDKSYVPYPGPFIQGIMNSFPERKTRVHFLQKYFQLLLHKKFPMKEPKLLLEGDSNSGKTSWAAVFEGLIPTENIAGVTQEGRFAGHLINNQTELVFMDEWTVNSLSCEDAKRILQGGLIMLSQKHASATKVMYNSGFFITTNVLPNFGISKDHDAVYNRLKVFSTKPLPKNDSSVTRWLRRHCMEVIHYCSEVLKETPLFESCDDAYVFSTKDDKVGSIYNDYDGGSDKLIMESDFQEDELSCSQSAHELIQQEIVRDPIVDDEDMDFYFLESDEATPARWAKTHQLFYTEKGTTHYQLCINTLNYMSNEDWKKVPINQEDIKRYEIRRKRKWRGGDTFYEAWLARQETVPETPLKDMPAPNVSTSTPTNVAEQNSNSSSTTKTTLPNRVLNFSPIKRKKCSQGSSSTPSSSSKTSAPSPPKSSKRSPLHLLKILYSDYTSDDDDEVLPSLKRTKKSQKLEKSNEIDSGTSTESASDEDKKPPRIKGRKTPSVITDPVSLITTDEEEGGEVKPKIRIKPVRKTSSEITNPIEIPDSDVGEDFVIV